MEASVTENAKLLELARGSYKFKAANVAAKRQKMELKAEQEWEGQQYACNVPTGRLSDLDARGCFMSLQRRGALRRYGTMGYQRV
jgi:hypothetical protein